MRRLAVLAALLALPAAALPPPEADRKVFEGLEAGYALDFERSAAAFDAAERLAPDHPAGPFFQASLKWLEFSMRADIPDGGKDLEPVFERLIEETLARARRMRDKDPKSAEALFYLGAAHGMRGRWKIVKAQWIRAGREGWKSYRLLVDAVRLDPRFHDAYLGLGMYDYYSDRMPGIIKFAAALIVKGDKERGLRFVRMAVANGHYSVMEAQIFLAGIYTNYEREPLRALEIVKDLRIGRPDNLFLLYLEASARLFAADWAGAAAAGELLSAEARKRPYSRPHVSLFEVYLADAYLGLKDYARARAVAERCIEKVEDPERASVTYCRLRRAQAADVLGDRESALRDYAEVLKREEFYDSRKKARLGLESPATYERVVAELLQ